MSSASKTLDLLTHFSPDRPEIGLSALCRLAGRDKATTYRHLQVLEDAGFVEQNPVNKLYRLGPALLQLAQTRELTVPRKAGVEAPLHRLAEVTGETAHASVLSGRVLYQLMSCESPIHSIRVTIEIQTFPLHATASGLCALAYGPAELWEVALADPSGFTEHTLTTRAALEQAVAQIRATGFSASDGGYEADVLSHAAPLFDTTGLFAGAVTVACVATRHSPALEQRIKSELVTASREISRNWGGAPPAALEQTWAQSLSTLPALDTAS